MWIGECIQIWRGEFARSDAGAVIWCGHGHSPSSLWLPLPDATRSLAGDRLSFRAHGIPASDVRPQGGADGTGEARLHCRGEGGRVDVLSEAELLDGSPFDEPELPARVPSGPFGPEALVEGELVPADPDSNDGPWRDGGDPGALVDNQLDGGGPDGAVGVVTIADVKETVAVLGLESLRPGGAGEERMADVAALPRSPAAGRPLRSGGASGSGWGLCRRETQSRSRGTWRTVTATSGSGPAGRGRGRFVKTAADSFPSPGAGIGGSAPLGGHRRPTPPRA